MSKTSTQVVRLTEKRNALLNVIVGARPICLA